MIAFDSMACSSGGAALPAGTVARIRCPGVRAITLTGAAMAAMIPLAAVDPAAARRTGFGNLKDLP